MLHQPYNKLKGVLREKDLTYEDVSKILGISKATLCRKINGGSDFYLSEVSKMESIGIPDSVF